MHQMAIPPIVTAELIKSKLNHVSQRNISGNRSGRAYWLNFPLGEVRRFKSSSVDAAPIKLTAKLRVIKPPLNARGTMCP